MNAVATSLARVRGIEEGRRLRLLRVLALASTFMLFLIVSTGALVRLTSSGLGCEHWPGCQAGNPFPATGYHSYIEFGNRVVGAVTILVTLVTWFVAFATDILPRWATRTMLAVFLGTLAQAPLGALTVYANLHPLLVIPHLLLSIAVLGGAVVVALETLVRRATSPALPELQRPALVLVGACFALIVSGTFATAAGPHSGGDDVARFGTLTVALAVHAVAVAVFLGGLLLAVGYLVARRTSAGLLLPLTAGVAVLLLVQMGIGELQYRTHLPWGLVLVHVGVAAAVWIGTVSIAALVRRPPVGWTG
jgi:cytochrome c oxidase assembly protein subunit 15